MYIDLLFYNNILFIYYFLTKIYPFDILPFSLFSNLFLQLIKTNIHVIVLQTY